MFREFPGQPYNPTNQQQNPFQYAAQQTVDFYGNLGYPKPDYPVLMQQQYYDNYQYNKMFSSQVFTPHVQPIFIAGPIYKNSPMFYGPQYLSQSLFQPVEKKRSYNYSKPDEVIESYDSNHLTSKQQIEENIRIRNQVLDQWNFEEEQKLKTQNQNKTETKRQSQESIHSQESIKSQKIIEKKNQVPEKKQNQISFKSLPKIEEEQQQAKKEKQQISTQKRKKRGRKNLRVMLKALTFIVMYFFRMKNTLLKRKKLQMNKQNSQESVNKAIAEGADWVLTFLEKELLEFWNKKEPLNWLENDQLSDKEKRNRINKVKQFIDKITITLNEQIKSTSFPKYFQEFLAQITQNFQFVPDQYLFNFELIRLQFNSFSALKNMGTQQKKMNIAFLLMIRILGFTILYTPWTLGMTNITKTKILESNSLIVVSVLQELVIFDFRELPANENNQNHLSIDVKVNPRPQGPLQAIPDSKVQQQKQHLKNLQEPLIYPSYNKEEMKDLFDEQAEWVDGILYTLDEINSKIVYIIDNWHKKNKVKITDGLKKNR